MADQGIIGVYFGSTESVYADQKRTVNGRSESYYTLAAANLIDLRTEEAATRSSVPQIQHIPYWEYDPTGPNLKYTLGSIAGAFDIPGEDVFNMLVRLFYKPNGTCIKTVRTDSGGNFRFDFLEFGKPYYTVIGYREGYNAIVFDDVVPVLSKTLP